MTPHDDLRPIPTARPRGAAPLTLIACVAMLVLPLVPGMLSGGGAAALLGLPAESIAVVLVLLIVGQRHVRALAAGAFGAVVVAAALAAALDLGFRVTIDRPFDPVDDATALIDAFGVVADSLGQAGATAVVILVVVMASAAAMGMARAALRVARVVHDEGRRGRLAIGAITASWVVLSLAGAHVAPGVPMAASRSGDELVATSARAVTSIREMQAFDEAVALDRLEAVPGETRFTALAGKDVVIAFVESYGRIAVEPSPFTHQVHRVLDEGGASLAEHGYAARSAFLTSPTFGGVSWLAHSTLQSGVWVDSRQKYARLLSGDRQTLSGMFGAAGWRTMAVVPSNTRPWEAGERFYGFDATLDSRNMGYRGPAFGYARMPDQYTWSVFHEQAGRDSRPVMAEVDLVSSHMPWTPLPRMVPWSQLGDGSVFEAQAARDEAALQVWSDPDRVRARYGESVAHTLEATFSYLETFDQPDLVLVLLGDHQPSRIVSGDDADHDVPVTIIAKDPAVFDAIASWGWQEGVHPTPDAPVWRMDEFRDRFVDAFSG